MKNKGFTFLEALISISVFVLVSASVFQAYSLLIETARISRLRLSATLVANEEMEIARNLPYESIGTVGGIPNGVLLQSKVVEKDGSKFNVTTSVRNVDDPFDGTIGGEPNDSSPADYKLVDVSVLCVGCDESKKIKIVTNIAPKGLETTSNNGALFINVFDALGNPVSGANVSISNNIVSPTININETTDNNGSLQLVDVPPSNQDYSISVSKSGYSSDMTYDPNSPVNPNPTKPHATVAERQVTQISFSIDRSSTLNVSSKSETCTTTPNLSFNLIGAKIIGSDPVIYKYEQTHTTNSSGQKNISEIEWDTYTISITEDLGGSHFLVGTLPITPISLLPNSEQNIMIITKPKSPNALLVSVKDFSTKLPITGALVSLSSVGDKTTGRGSQVQTDWSLGGGQYNFNDTKKFYDYSNMSFAETAGEIKLVNILDQYETSGYLESSSFDTGSASNFYNLSWGPVDQPEETGVNSVKFQIASNNDNSTWNYIGPDGTGGTFFTSSGESLGSYHNGNRYLRYKIYLSTEDTSFTPNISDVSFSFTSACMPSGQVFFDGLSSGTYEITITKEGYESILSEPVSITSDWQEKVINMTPQE